MPKQLVSGLKGKYPSLDKHELWMVRSFFYLGLLLLTGSLVVVGMDLSSFFNTNYLPHALSVTGIAILMLFFIWEGKKNTAAAVLLLIPVPVYFLMISAKYAIFSPESSFSYELYLFSAGLLLLLLLSDSLTIILLYLVVTTFQLIVHLQMDAPPDQLTLFLWTRSHTFHPMALYFLISTAALLLHLTTKLRFEEKQKSNIALQDGQTRMFHQYFEGILKISAERDEMGEKAGYKVCFVNPAFEEYFEVRNSEVKGTPAHLLFQKLFRGEVDWQSLIDPSRRTKKEIFVPHTSKWFKVSSLPIDKDNLICFFENITVIKNSIAELANSRHRYKLLLETIPDIFFVIDKEGTYIDYVPKSDNGIDKLAGEIIGSTIFEVGFSMRMVNQVSKSIRTVIENDAVETIEYALEVKGKGNCFFEMRMVKLNNHSVMAISRDISKQKYALQAIEEARKKAEEADMLKAAFLRNISHEVRTPLSAIGGFANILLSDEVNRKERMNYLQIIARNSQILLHVFSDTIKLSKVQSGIETVNLQYFNINGLIKDLKRHFDYEKKQLEKEHLKITDVYAREHPKFSIHCDGSKIRDIMENLLDNAIKFTEEGEIVFGYAIPENSVIEFFVQDTGIGIEPEQCEKIFDRFYQVDLRIQRLYGGSGIGLSLANDFAHLMNSRIIVESTPGKGSRFSFSLPLDTGHSHLRIV